MGCRCAGLQFLYLALALSGVRTEVFPFLVLVLQKVSLPPVHVDQLYDWTSTDWLSTLTL